MELIPRGRLFALNSLLLAPITAVVILLAKSVVQHEGFFYGWWTGIVFYGIPTAFLGVMLVALCLPFAVRAKLVLAVWSTIFAILAFEFVLELKDGPPTSLDQMRLQTSARLHLPFDRRSKREVVDNLRAAGQDAVPVLPVALYFHKQQQLQIGKPEQGIVPLSGVAKAVTVFGNEGGNYLIYVSDEHGFANPPGSFDDQELDVAILGDSFAHGACVPVGKDSASLIRTQFPHTLNLGYVGAGPLSYLGTLTEYALPRRPRIVLWFHCEGNDFHNLRSERDTLLAHYLEPDFEQDLPNLRLATDLALKEFIEQRRQDPEESVNSQSLLRRVLSLQRLKDRLLLVCRDEDVRSASQISYFQQILQTAKTRVQQSGGELYLVYLPSFDRYAGRTRACKNQESQVLEAMRQVELPVINVAAIFDRQTDPVSLFPLRLSGHYTEEGYALVAREILDQLSAKTAKTRTTMER